MNKNFLTLLLLPFLLVASACDSGDPDDDGNNDGNDNDANIQVSGAIQGDYSGIATFVSVLGLSHAITIVFDDGKGTATLSAFGSADEGTYAIGEASDAGIFGVQLNLVDLEAVDGVQSGNVFLTSGSVTITTKNDDKIAGRFNGSGPTLTGEAQISVTGTFDARCFASLGLCTTGG